jgi:hypothetical protein
MVSRSRIRADPPGVHSRLTVGGRNASDGWPSAPRSSSDVGGL